MVTRPPLPAPPYAGGCLCGLVRWRLESRPLGVNACHCSDCKKLSGSTNIVMLSARAADFSVERGGDTAVYVKRAASGREVAVHRCPRCGARLWHAPRSAPELVFIAAGTLDDPSWAVPASHTWTAQAAPGVLIPEDAYTHPGQPENRDGIHGAFARLYPE